MKLASEFGDKRVVSYLVLLHKRYPAIDPACQNNAPLKLAAANGKLAVFKYLLQSKNYGFSGIDPSVRNLNKQTKKKKK